MTESRVEPRGCQLKKRTPPMTSAERAKDLANAMARHIIGEDFAASDETCSECVALALAAITSAQNDKLEEAAKQITARILDFEDSDTDPEFDVTDTVIAYELRQVRDEIRSLKSKD